MIPTTSEIVGAFFMIWGLLLVLVSLIFLPGKNKSRSLLFATLSQCAMVLGGCIGGSFVSALFSAFGLFWVLYCWEKAEPSK